MWRRLSSQSCLDGDAVVANADTAVGNSDVFAGLRVDAVRVGRIGWIDNGHVADLDGPAQERMDGPRRGVCQAHTFDSYTGAVVEGQEPGPGIGQGSCATEFPPWRALTVDCAIALNGDILCACRRQQGLVRYRGNALPALCDQREVGMVVTADEDGVWLKPQSNACSVLGIRSENGPAEQVQYTRRGWLRRRWCAGSMP